MSSQKEKKSEYSEEKDEWMEWVHMAAPSPGRALKALSALSQSNLTMHRLGLALGTRPNRASHQHHGAGASGWRGATYCTALAGSPQATKKKKKKNAGGEG